MTAPSNLTAAGSPFSAAPKIPASPPLGIARPGSPLAAQGRLPLAFMALGLAWIGGATALLLAEPTVLAQSHAAPAVVALTHAWVLGVFVTVATGAVYQIAPVALGATLWSERYGWWHFALQAVSVPGMVFAFARWDMALLGHFGAAFAMGIVLFVTNTWKTVRASGRRDPVAWSLLLAAGWLMLTVFVGLLAAANRHWHFLPLDPLALLRAHAHLGLVGFFVTLLQGVSFRLVPMFTLGDVPDWRPVRRGLWLSQLGLIGLVPTLAIQANAAAFVFAALLFSGLIVSGHALRQTFGTRRKRALDPSLRAFFVGLVGLAAAAIAGCFLLWPGTPWGSAPGGFNAMVYAVIVLGGGLLPIFTGMMGKIVPFLTWMRAYGPKVGRGPTPAATALTSPRLESWALRLQAGAILPLAAGVWTLHEGLLVAGCWCFGAGIACFQWNMGRTLSHLWRPVVPKVPARPPILP